VPQGGHKMQSAINEFMRSFGAWGT
jgi:hypothetical protein